MARSEFFGAQQCDDEIEEQAGGDDAAENQVKHGGSLPIAENDVADQDGETRAGKHQEKHIGHRSTFATEVRYRCAPTR
jgi:hypothetical protein